MKTSISRESQRSLPAGLAVRASEIGHPHQGAIWLDVDGKRKQTGDLNQLISLDLSAVPLLANLFCGDNRLTDLAAADRRRTDRLGLGPEVGAVHLLLVSSESVYRPAQPSWFLSHDSMLGRAGLSRPR